LLLLPSPAATLPPAPASVAILYNSSIPESKALAQYYSEARNIPATNLVGLAMPKSATISRKQYDETIRDPLRKEFDMRNWWQIGKSADGFRIPVRNKIRIIVTVRGVPLKIKRTSLPGDPKPLPKPKPGEPKPKLSPQDKIRSMNEASVDSELSLFGVREAPLQGFTANKFYNSPTSIATANIPFMVLVGRIDAADDATCRRMIADAIATEKSGLWGRAYIDIAHKYPEGDKWLEGVAKSCAGAGFPTVVDRFKDTYPTNYPMTDAAIYFGWYAWNANGPLLDPGFRFKRGAVAVHLHSFSANQLTDAKKNWCAPVLAKGAAATLGNVYEPFLSLTHNFDIFLSRLLAGHTLVESAYMSVRGLSWQNIVLGDPLYRPFLHLDGTGQTAKPDRDYRALRLATLRWGATPATFDKQVSGAAKKLKSGTLYEALGLIALSRKQTAAAVKWFQTAETVFPGRPDKLRQELHIVAIERAAKHKPEAIQRLRAMKSKFQGLPQAAAITAWLNILDPPPPPPVKK
jgi:uncharacterized protein (TIGR03790 family)